MDVSHVLYCTYMVMVMVMVTNMYICNIKVCPLWFSCAPSGGWQLIGRAGPLRSKYIGELGTS